MPRFYEFFSGGGMARLGLGDNWQCIFANDICEKKVATYIDNFGDEEVVREDIYNLSASDLPDMVDLVWGSFPCQDLSVAGNGAGLNGKRSGTFNKLMSILMELKRLHRSPRLVVLENVVGAISSRNGKDFQTIVGSLVDLGYMVGCVVIDGADFVPQSRPRLFIVATTIGKKSIAHMIKKVPIPYWHPENLVKAYKSLPDSYQGKWVWWNLPIPPSREIDLIDIVEESPSDVLELSPADIKKLLAMMSKRNLDKIESAKEDGGLVVGGLYKRGRRQKDGRVIQRAEVRFDGNAGCLRTPAGGSSRQTLMIIEAGTIKARLLSRREAARLMGVPDSYKLPKKNNDAYHVFGDGLVVPAVAWLEESILMPICRVNELKSQLHQRRP